MDFKKVREQGETAVKREEIVQAERELDAVLELIQESEGISGRDDIKRGAYERKKSDSGSRGRRKPDPY